ncbi:MAG: hypothetical protein QOF60_310 [Actinomycetota bacterium]|jgi:uncharacterized protein (DUF1697 family)|nr:hypothetical protein [Actinomycetota bacterium]
MNEHVRYAALLRGVNVGGHNAVGMAPLREVLSSLGYEDVATLLQSGNAVFTAPASAKTDGAARIEAAVADRFGVSIKVLLRDAKAMAKVVASNPWPERAAAEPAKAHVAFLGAKPAAAKVSAVDHTKFAPDELVVVGDAAYLWYPNGSGRSKLGATVFEKGLGVVATARNWNTVLKLRDLMS